jgi:6-phosphogluconate dehydrogenase
MGVSGSGKSTIGQLLADRLGIPFYDGDDFHPEPNIAKMQSGQSLTDPDRIPWLEAINQHCKEEQYAEGCVIACSALKAMYRDILRDGVRDLHWISLVGDFQSIYDRIQSRKGHFMPPELLQSQFDTWEEPTDAIAVNIMDEPEEIISTILKRLEHMSSEFGLIGLGVMGKSLSRNLANNGFKLSLFNRHVDGKEEHVAVDFVKSFPELQDAAGYDDLKEFVNSINTPRKVMLMVNAGKPVDAVIDQLIPLLDDGDVIIDGGNSHYKQTDQRAALLAEHGIEFIGTGVSGGEEGALKGPSIMPGGSTDAYSKAAPYLEAIAAKDSGGNGCCAHVGKGGAGHFVKMVHNGIEYAEMQLIAECYSLLRYVGGYDHDKIADLFDEWCSRDLGSYLLEISAQILRKKEGDQYVIDQILDKAGNKGTGSWTTIAAAELGVPITMITGALFARYTSAYKSERVNSDQLYNQGVESSIINLIELEGAYRIARIANHHQGLHLIDAASETYEWNLNFPEIARIWTNGCIIRSKLMKQLIPVLGNTQRILQHSKIISVVQRHRIDLAEIVSQGHQTYCAIPCLSAASDYINTYTQAQSSANMIQAQRDFFGAHTYKRVDDPEGPSHHTRWS